MKELEIVYKNSYNYHTEFSCKGSKGGANYKMGSAACFHSFSNYKGKQEFIVVIHKGTKLTESHPYYCGLTSGQLKYHVEVINTVIPKEEFELLWIEEDEEKYKISFVITSEDNTRIFAWILTWIRFAWEIPYSLALIDAYNLFEELGDKLDIFQCWKLASTLFPSSVTWGTGHSACKAYKKLYDLESLKKMVHEEGSLNSMFESYSRYGAEGEKPMELSSFERGEKESYFIGDLEYYTKNEFNKRLDTYKKALEFYEKA